MHRFNLLSSVTCLSLGVFATLPLAGCGGGDGGGTPNESNPVVSSAFLNNPSTTGVFLPVPLPVPAGLTDCPQSSPGPSCVGSEVPTLTANSEESIETAEANVPTDSLPTDAMFAPTSFWYAMIPASVPLHPNSAGFTADFQRQVETYYGNVAVNMSSYSSPVFVAPAGAVTKAVQFWDCQGKRYTDPGIVEQWSAVPIPSVAEPSSGTDGEMTVYQPSTDTIWEFWQTRNSAGQWQACWGGRLKGAKTSQGIWPKGYGTTATGLPFLGGQITAEELARGEIRHAIGIALVDLESANIFSWPANRSDGYNPNRASNRIAEGQRFRLDPTVNVDALNIHPVTKIIAKAAQKYGFVVWDKAGAISVRFQNPKSYTALGKVDPYKALLNGTPEYALFNGFPWHRLQFLPMDYGKP